MMTNDEGKEFLDILMDATGKVVDARTVSHVRMEPAVVRLVADPYVYVRPIADVTTPTTASPSSISDLDAGDVRVWNYSGCALVAGDQVDVQYINSIEFGFIVRRYGTSGGGGGGGSDITVEVRNGSIIFVTE